MTVRLLDATASDFWQMDAPALADSIRAAEGRTIAAEVLCTDQPPIDGISHGEIAAAMGADMIVLDRYDCDSPVINGAPPAILESPTPLADYKKLLGRPLGVNLIVADAEAGGFLKGRLVSLKNVEKVISQGADMIFLYVRPQLGGSPPMMHKAAREIKQAFDDAIFLVGVPSFSTPAPRTPQALQAFEREITALLGAGCESIGLPMPGSKQGWLMEQTARLVDSIHAEKGLAWLFLTASVEGAPQEVMAPLALAAKQIGADAYRLDEAGLSGMPVPENIWAFSVAIRGRRHTFRRMACSILR